MFSLVGLALSAVVHLATLVNADIERLVPYIWVLHVGIFVVCVPMLILIMKSMRINAAATFFRDVLPKSLLFLLLAVFAYGFINFALCSEAFENGNPMMQGNGYVIRIRGQSDKEISYNEYMELQIKQMRAFSGLWLIFYFASFAYFSSERVSARSSP